MNIRNRIIELRQVPAGELKPSPRNWRRHPQAQHDALRSLLAEVGIADALLAREVDGGLELIDGHLRADTDPAGVWPVLELDVTAAEADMILATLDPLAAMAEPDPAALDALLAGLDCGSEAVSELLSSLGADAGLITDEGGSVSLKQMDTKPPPKMTWALIGIPTVRFGEIAEVIETVAGLPETIVETTSNDG